MFAATAATIVSGAVAERVNFRAYLVFSVVVVAVIYPVFGSWAWGGLFNGGGWLEGLGFLDFAGSTVVHSVGAWAALAGALVVGRRAGSLDADGNPVEMPGHSIPLAALGVFILWFGWFGFNAGSTTAGGPGIALIVANTFLAAGAGALAAMTVTWVANGVPSVTMTMNGVLGGLVGITAGCDAVLPVGALGIGLIAGVLVVFATQALARYIDDPVSAVAVHGACGVWGTLAVALFAADGFSLAQLGVQVVGVGAAFLWTFPLSFGLFKVLDATMGLRITDEGEEEGLDLHEHGTVAYPEFQMMMAAAVDDRSAGDADGTYRLDAIQLEASQALRTPLSAPPRARA